MEINTLYYGKMECQENEIVHFSEGLFGFESQKDFLPIPFEEEKDTVLCLQSVTERDVCFVIMNPFQLDNDYDPVLKKEDYAALGTEEEKALSFYVICVMRQSMEECTVNMKCPIVVNTKSRQAVQVILENKAYKFRHSLSEFLGGGNAVC